VLCPPGRWLDPKPADTTAERRKRHLVPVGFLGIALDGILKPRSEPNIGSTGRGASGATRTGRTSPIIFCRVDATGASARAIQGTNVAYTDFATPQVVEMDINFRRGIDGYVDVFIADYVVGDNGSENGRAATAAVDVNSHRAGGSGVELVGKISGDEVADDLVSGHVVCRKAKSRADVGVEGDTSQSVTRQLVSDDHIAGDTALASAIGKHASSRASNLHAIARRDVVDSASLQVVT
jgi:hypothetical protein